MCSKVINKLDDQNGLRVVLRMRLNLNKLSTMENNVLSMIKSTLSLFILTHTLNVSSGVLYNTSTHEKISPDQIAGGGTRVIQ